MSAPPGSSPSGSHHPTPALSGSTPPGSHHPTPALSGSTPPVDLVDPDTFERGIPHDFFARKRREEPVFWHPERPPNSGFWAVTKFDDIVAVSKDWETYSSQLGHVGIEELEPDELAVRQSMLETDPPNHSRLRRIVSPLFTPRAVGQYEDFARELCREVLDAARERDEFDLVEEIAKPFPINVLLRILGCQREDGPRLVELSDQMIANTDPDLTDVVLDRDDTSAYRLLPFRSPAALELFDYGHALAAERRERPQDDLITKLAHAEVDGDRLSDRELGNFLTLLVIAGNETTRQTIAHTMLALVEHPDEWRRLRDHPALMPTAVEEFLRWASPVIQFRRTASRDTELRGVQVARGDKVVVWYVSGNFDEDAFPDPYRFDVGRDPNDHCSFGPGGPHHCLGAYLARLEIRIMFEELLPRLAELELTGPVKRVRSYFANGYKEMPVRVRWV